MNYVDPSRENFDRFKALPRDTPIHMLNMIRFRALADYPAGHENAGKAWTGEQAFAEYVRGLLPIIDGLGGSLVWQGQFECIVTGPAEFEWDRVFIMGFPSAAAFLGLVTNADYKAHVVVHRTAGVEDSRLVRFGGAMLP